MFCVHCSSTLAGVSYIRLSRLQGKPSIWTLFSCWCTNANMTLVNISRYGLIPNFAAFTIAIQSPSYLARLNDSERNTNNVKISRNIPRTRTFASQDVRTCSPCSCGRGPYLQRNNRHCIPLDYSQTLNLDPTPGTGSCCTTVVPHSCIISSCTLHNWDTLNLKLIECVLWYAIHPEVKQTGASSKTVSHKEPKHNLRHRAYLRK